MCRDVRRCRRSTRYGMHCSVPAREERRVTKGAAMSEMALSPAKVAEHAGVVRASARNSGEAV